MRNLSLTAVLVAAGIAIAPNVMAAQATGAVNVRSGPSVNYRVVDQLFRGENVTVQSCRSNGWCLISHPGPDGWVSSRYLRDGGGSTRRGPDVSFSFSFGGSTSGGGGPAYEELVCLVTFYRRDQVAAGADADVERARLLPRSVAEERDGANDRRAIFDYGSDAQTRDTCNYLDSVNN